MRKLIIPLLFLIFLLIAVAGSPNRSLVNTTASTLGANSYDTVTVSNVVLGGDSIGVMLSLNKDSVTGWVQYQYVTPDGYSAQAFANSSTLTTFSITAGNQGVFSSSLPRLAGSYNANFYLIIKNIKSSSQVITTKTYTITWR